jgi:hypothetical protein
MKNDRYLKFILTVIAFCLLWICFREIPIIPKLHADSPNNLQATNVHITGCDSTALYLAEPIEVKIHNIAELAGQINALKQKD